ncbi:hypothetical protein ACQEVG_17945 [Streptomyces sp. CA-135486]|uniref:hypothetical protein n=1 Tax=Streptomyces sp. CA-135486 TaxID=3240049 RepID=UPI003D8A19DB
MRFTQAGGAFDNVVAKSAPSAEGWRRDAVGEMNQTDWEKYHGAIDDHDRLRQYQQPVRYDDVAVPVQGADVSGLEGGCGSHHRGVR